MTKEDVYRGLCNETILKQLLNAKKHNFCNYYIVQKIQYMICDLMCQQEKNVIHLIQSDDQESFYLGIQLMFKDYLDLYNELCENPKWENLIIDTVKNYKYYIDLNG